MSIFIESLKRLFLANKITIEKLNELLSNEKIKEDEFNYIIS